MMNVNFTGLDGFPDVKLFSPLKHGDERGFFSEVYKKDFNESLGIECNFMQDNHAFSRDAGVLRGLHYQSPPYAQDKLVRVIKGAIWDVWLDVRHGSPSFGKWGGVEISAENWKQVLVPRGFAHGYVTLEPNTEVLYKVNKPYAPDNDFGIAWDDAEIGIDWRLPCDSPIISAKDLKHPTLSNAAKHFTFDEK